jgi:hypothetical protein
MVILGQIESGWPSGHQLLPGRRVVPQLILLNSRGHRKNKLRDEKQL